MPLLFILPRITDLAKPSQTMLNSYVDYCFSPIDQTSIYGVAIVVDSQSFNTKDDLFKVKNNFDNAFKDVDFVNLSCFFDSTSFTDFENMYFGDSIQKTS